MHLCVTSKNAKWCHLIWPTLYVWSDRYSACNQHNTTLQLSVTCHSSRPIVCYFHSLVACMLCGATWSISFSCCFAYLNTTTSLHVAAKRDNDLADSQVGLSATVYRIWLQQESHLTALLHQTSQQTDTISWTISLAVTSLCYQVWQLCSYVDCELFVGLDVTRGRRTPTDETKSYIALRHWREFVRNCCVKPEGEHQRD